jgi:preprotein translocase subunit YajC
MSFFISDAFAEGAVSPGQGPISDVLFFLLVGAALFFLVFLPQMRRNKDQKRLLESLNKGAEVVTSGGILGRIVDVDDNFVLLEVNEDVHINVQKHSVTQMMPKGTYKARKRTEK